MSQYGTIDETDAALVPAKLERLSLGATHRNCDGDRHA